ncbi:MAG: flagellar hook-associated protein FlgK [Verrucomicrobiota bacterium]
MSLLSGIYTQSRALSYHSGSIDVAGKNIANVNNPEYARQRMLVQDRGNIVVGNTIQSMGIEAGLIQQFRDSLLDTQILTETPQTSMAEVTADLYRQLEGYWGESINRSSDGSTLDSAQEVSASSLGLNERLDDFFNAMSELAANPSESALKEVVVQQSQALVDQINDMASNLSQFSGNIDQQIDNELSDANAILAQIAELNIDIAQVEMRTSVGAAVDLRDARQEKVEELSKLMDIEVTTIADSFGQIQITAKNAANADVTLVNLGNVADSFSFDGTNINFGTTAMGLTGGEVQAHLDFRNGPLAELQTDIDNLASQLVTSVNAVYPGDFFTAAGTTAATFSLDGALNSTTLVASATANAGANDVAQAIYNLKNSAFSTAGGDDIDGGFNEFVINISGRIGQASKSAAVSLENQEFVQRMLENERAAQGGVDLDEEAADLIRFQRAYQATSRVISVMDELLQQLVSGF